MIVMLNSRDHKIHELVRDVFQIHDKCRCMIVRQEFNDISCCQGVIGYPLPHSIPQSKSEAVLIIREFVLELLMQTSVDPLFIVVIIFYNLNFFNLTFAVRVEALDNRSDFAIDVKCTIVQPLYL